MITNSEMYDILKWVAIICMPAFEIAIPALFEVWGIPYGEEIAKTLNILAVLIGTLLGVSNVKYNQTKAEENSLVQTTFNDDVVDAEAVDETLG